jgi:hypothetical protein
MVVRRPAMFMVKAVHRLAYNGDVAAGSAAADFSRRASEAPILDSYGRSAAAEEKQSTGPVRGGALKRPAVK